MQFAICDGVKTRPSPDKKAVCPCCKDNVISKCGDIIIWHWSHKSGFDCDPWYEGETLWHIDWKNNFPEVNQEVTLGKHRADIFCNGNIVELQHSPIDVFEANEREVFYSKYGKMMWVFDMREQYSKGLIDLRVKISDDEFDFKIEKSIMRTFRWKHPHEVIWHLKKEIYLDLGDKLLRITKIYDELPCGGWGNLISKKTFIAWVKNGFK